MRLDITSAAVWYVAGITFAIALSGCATSATPAGATTAQKLKDDMAAIAQTEADVKAQCGADFAPLAVQAGAVLSIAEAAASASAGNVAGAVGSAVAAFPVIAGDAKGIACVVKVLQADYAKYKPKPAAWLIRARQYQLVAYSDPVPEPCTNAGDEGACRKVVNVGHVEWPDAGVDGGQ